MNTRTQKNLDILPATVADLELIYNLFEKAIAYQKANGYIGWNSYDKDFIRKDIEQQLLFKMMRSGQVCCIFSLCFSDAFIWRGMENGEALYLHRLVVHPAHRGNKNFQTVLEWAIQLAGKRQLKQIRMDTWAENTKLISYYKNYGFQFVEEYTTPDSPDLPVQHRLLKVALLELDLKGTGKAME
ncbi:MAG TPA: GNAT family N-acetyltransferase [Flavisolibacter sp.]|jgi:ribosomal protein S18 acetylase RimI-like enzyme|nr:GNAT family N-acetyltransferase [Flavisolibacter sp.]